MSRRHPIGDERLQELSQATGVPLKDLQSLSLIRDPGQTFEIANNLELCGN